MPFYRDTLGLPDSAFGLLRDLIHERTGLFYDNGKNELLTDKLSPLVIDRGFNSFLDYYYLLKYDAADDEWKRVINALSVQETYFWREIDQVHALVDVLVPRYFSTFRSQPLKIWSAACATGEEPITLAIALEDKGWLDRVQIHGSDASTMAIEKAKLGVFRQRAFRNLTADLRDRYFVENDGARRVDPRIHNRIKWSIANLANEADVALLASSSQVIFCRNLFIYFSDDAIRKTLRMLHRLMPSPGYLFVGASESLLRMTADFEFQEIGGAFVYVKK